MRLPLFPLVTHRNTRRIEWRRLGRWQKPRRLTEPAPAESPAPPDSPPPTRAFRHRDTSQVIDWARRINSGWFVRNGLADTAAAWLDYLEKTDPVRLHASCEAARNLSRGPDRINDPKPWFYGGLFILATEAEARQFLSRYRLTSAVIPALAGDPECDAWVAGLSEPTQILIARLRGAIRGGDWVNANALPTGGSSSTPPAC